MWNWLKNLFCWFLSKSVSTIDPPISTTDPNQIFREQLSKIPENIIREHPYVSNLENQMRLIEEDKMRLIETEISALYTIWQAEKDRYENNMEQVKQQLGKGK